MNSFDTAFIAALRNEIDRHRARCVATIMAGTLKEREYAYSCGFTHALDQIVRRSDPANGVQPGMIEQILEDMRKE